MVSAGIWATDASETAAAFRFRDIDDTLVSRSRHTAICDIGLPSCFEYAGPAAKIRLLQYAKPGPSSLSHFSNAGSQLNIMLQVQGSIRSVAAGAQRWASYCDPVNIAYFPTELLMKF